MKKYKIVIIIIVLLKSITVNAQLPVDQNLYFENPYSVNPASMFHDEYMEITVNTKQSYVGVDNAPLTNSLYLSGPVGEKVGLGLSVLNASQGAFSINDFKGSYAYKVKLSDNQSLQLGLSLGLSWQKFDASQIHAVDMDDPIIINESYLDQKYFINELGFVYQLKRFQFGASSPYILQKDYLHYIAYSSIDIGSKNMDSGFKVTPMVYYQRIPEGLDQISGILKLKYKPIWTSFTYCSNRNLKMGTGLTFNHFKISYSYQYNNSTLANIAQSNQEIMLTYRFKYKKRNPEVPADEEPSEEITRN